MFQFQIYPTGIPSNYKIQVNSPAGVTAIEDHRMGVVEHSLSGVAFYIKAINDYVNIHNVGTSGYPIVSGFFNHVGFNDYSVEVAPLDSTDGIISGVHSIYSSGVSITDSYPDVKNLYSSSGLFSNTIINNSILDGSNITNFIFSDIQNLYSGYIDIPTEFKLYQTQQNIDSKETYPYNLGGSGILNNITIRPRLNINDNYVGFYKDSFAANTFFIYNQSGVISNNTYIFGSYTTNLSSYNGTYFHESLFELKSHTHDGLNSTTIPFSNFNSTKPISKPFVVFQSNESVIVKNKYIGNDIGLSCGWELVDINNISNIQNIYTCKEKLYILDDTKLSEFDGEQVVDAVGTYPRSLVIATNKGDSPAVIDLIKSRNYKFNNDIDDVVAIYITTINNPDTRNKISLPYKGLNSSFTNIRSRKEIPMDGCTRIGGKVYIMFLEEFDGSRKVLTLYEIDTIANPMSIKPVAHCDLTGHGSDWLFLEPVRFKDTISYFFKNTNITEDKFVLVYNTIFHPSRNARTYNYDSGVFTEHIFERTPGERVGFNFFKNKNTILETVGLNEMNFSNTRHIQHTMYYNGLPVLAGGYTFTYNQRNMLNIISPQQSADYEGINAGYIYTGKRIDNIAYTYLDSDGQYEFVKLYKEQLQKITSLETPWAVSHTIFDGWLYAIAPIQEHAIWSDYTGDKIDMNVNLPNGSLLVRMRSSEINLILAGVYTS
jgi:hypothetical protein